MTDPRGAYEVRKPKALGHCCFAGCSLVTCPHCLEQRCVQEFHICQPEPGKADEESPS